VAKRKPWYKVGSISHLGIEFLDEVLVDGKSPKDAVDRYSDLLAIAYGLSFHRADFPDFYSPGQVTPFRPDQPRKEIKDFDDSVIH